uniref:Uncharacterized protein n=1 Tax=Toxoplasma gondii COUG TaxID=1074873 RepID=A0A2G8Y1X8_TOXGO|nr:hypothetical protein TGCOUG_271310 [Toxoplasma gondii COUG]
MPTLGVCLWWCSNNYCGYRPPYPSPTEIAFLALEPRQNAGSVSSESSQSYSGQEPQSEVNADAAALTDGKRYAQQFDCAVVSNVATTPLFKHCGVLADPPPRRKSRLPGEVESSDEPVQQSGEKVFKETLGCSTPVCGDAPAEPSFLERCLKPTALVCVETFK